MDVDPMRRITRTASTECHSEAIAAATQSWLAAALLVILQKWGKLSYNPEPKDIVHFDVIEQLLKALRQWPFQVRLVKIKSHTGCLLNEHSDEQVEIGYSADDPKAFPGPQKFASLSIRTRSQVRNSARECKISIPRDSAPNHKILKGVFSTNICKAARQRNTIFVRQLLCRDEGRIIARTIFRCKQAEYRIWLKAMSGRYPVQTYLHRVKLVLSPQCLFCFTLRALVLSSVRLELQPIILYGIGFIPHWPQCF